VIDPSVRERLGRFGFDEALFDDLRGRVARGELSREANYVRGTIEPLPAAELTELDESAHTLGEQAIAAGEVAVAVLNGGMATRFGGVVKGIVPAVDGLSFLEWKLRDAAASGLPFVVMNSFATDEATHAFVREKRLLEPISFTQSALLRLTPRGDLFLVDGEPSPYAPGHGDFLRSIRSSGVLGTLRERGVRTLLLSNVDNLGARVDPLVVGAHLAAGRPLTAEVTRKRAGDVGGAPVVVDGRPMVVEGFRFPPAFDQDAVPIFATNTFAFDLDALAQEHDLTWLYVEKDLQGRTAVQLETLVNELSAFVPTTYLLVPREGARNRFVPVKTPDDLVRAEPELRALLGADLFT
jgi:UTP--glucose-1-phosphate uridylyltransferase